MAVQKQMIHFILGQNQICSFMMHIMFEYLNSFLLFDAYLSDFILFFHT